MLEIRQLNSGYGKKQVLYGISLMVQSGELAALIGPNGAGKSTVLRVIHGLLPAWCGEVSFEGTGLDQISPAMRVAKGITFAPQGNPVFAELSVWENLEMGGIQLSKSQTQDRIEEVLQFFPTLRDYQRKMAGLLSGGEQQMLALGRALMPKPKLLMLDEPSLGLSPSIVSQVFEKITEVNQTTGTSILIVEQKVRQVLQIVDRVYSLKLGRVFYEGKPVDLAENKDLMKRLFL
ncbi:MAG: ABC transporter ATP-binding protein [Acidobacteria bacterium]|nr:ABC transporter ATP-binding protein [Acidobacteriota bacterium]